MVASRSRRNASVSLVMTFILGMAVGFSLCYALMEAAGRMEPTSPDAEEAVFTASTPLSPAMEGEVATDAPDATVPEEQPQPDWSAAAEKDEPIEEFVPVQEPVQLTREETEALWPGRHLFLGIEAGLIEEEVTDMIARRRPGGVFVLSLPDTGPEIVAATIRQVRDAAGMGDSPADLPLAMVAGEDGPHTLPGVENKSTPEELGRGADTATLHAAAGVYAMAARNAGAALLLAPRLDVWREGAPAPRTQYFGATPDLTAQAGLAFARGLRDFGIVPLVNTYPGMSGGTPQPDGAPVIMETDVERLAELMLPFAEAADAQVPAILAGNASVPVLDRARPGRPACASPVMIREILREKWGYSGVVIADARDTGHFTAASLPRHVVDCLAAGCDAVLLGPVLPETVDDICEAIVAALQIGRISPQQYGQSRTRLEAMRNLVGRIAAPAMPGVASPPPPSGVATTGTQSLPEESTPETAPEIPQPVLPEETPPPPPSVREVVHVIEKGESISGIAAKYGVSTAELMELNKLRDGNIKFGNRLKIPVKEVQASPEELIVPPPPEAVMVEEPPAAEEPPSVEESPEEESGEKAAEAPETLEGSGETPPETPAPSEDAEIIPASETEALVAPEVPEMAEVPEMPEPDVIPVEDGDTALEGADVNAAPLQEEKDTGDIPEKPEETGGENAVAVAEPEPVVTEEPAEDPAPEPAATTGEEADPAAVEDHVLHTVQPGDTMYRISSRYGVPQKAIMELNGIADANLVKLGSTLKIPKKQ